MNANNVISVMCTTTTGCIIGGSGLGSGRQEQVAPGIQAANEILDTILARSCLDEHAQDQVHIFSQNNSSIISYFYNTTL